MTTVLRRLVVVGALGGAAFAVASCDTRLGTPTVPIGSTSSSAASTADIKPPTIAIDSPLVGALINVGDSLLVTLHLQDDRALASATIVGVTETGSVDLGTFTQTPRYAAVSIPLSGAFRPGLKDTTVRRYLQPVSATDTTLDSLNVIVVARDSTGNTDTAQVRVNIVAGPKVSVTSPVNNDSIPAGVGLSVAGRAQKVDGVASISVRVQGESNWPTKLDTTITQTYNNAPRDITLNGTAFIPIDAPLRGKITITASAVDVDRQPGSSSPVVNFVRAPSTAQPRVTQTVATRSEFTDSVTVTASGQGIADVGIIIRDTTNAIIQTDTVKLSPPYNGNVSVPVPLNLPPTQQGKRLGITGFAIDQQGRVGYAVPTTQSVPDGTLANGIVDSTLVVYGRTFPLPHQGVIGDIAVDAARGNVFVSNTQFNLLDVWQNPSQKFDPTGVAVGSLPWGLFVSNNPDTLLVANSGGTNISRVFIGSGSVPSMHEDLPNRILTRNTYLFTVTVSKDENTGRITLTATGPISYSDRPQYIAQSAGGRIFYSTEPTTQAPLGTIRWLDPSLPVPDPEQIWQYGTITASTDQTYAIFNVDSLAIGTALPSSNASDTLFLWDHPYGQKTGVVTASDPDPLVALSALVAGGSDAVAVLRLDVSSLGLTDTTFVAASGDRSWVAFGEGNKTGAGRVMMVNDASGALPGFFSPVVTVSDLTDNASEQVFGVAIDKTGAMVAAHGDQAYFAFVANPFHLRLQGEYQSLAQGAGIAFHPLADATNLTDPNSRLAFVASTTGQIEIVDIAHYVNRGTLQLKNPIYGPLRASLPVPGDPPTVVLKLYALSTQGLVVIDLTAADIKAGPP